MIDARKAAQHGFIMFIEQQSVQAERVDIRLHHFAMPGIERATGLARRYMREILEMRIADGAPRVHNAGNIFTADVDDFRVFETDSMSVFMRRRGGGLQQVCQFEVAGIRVESIHERYITCCAFLDAKKIQLRVIVVPNFFGLKVGAMGAGDFKYHLVPFAPEFDFCLGLVPVLCNIVGDLLCQLIGGRIPVNNEMGTDDNAFCVYVQFCFPHGARISDSLRI
jgi:hypothetical protein